jgi:hypothetical protein
VPVLLFDPVLSVMRFEVEGDFGAEAMLHETGFYGPIFISHVW